MKTEYSSLEAPGPYILALRPGGVLLSIFPLRRESIPIPSGNYPTVVDVSHLVFTFNFRADPYSTPGGKYPLDAIVKLRCDASVLLAFETSGNFAFRWAVRT